MPLPQPVNFKAAFDREWTSEAYRLKTCPPKQIISQLNIRLQASNKKAVSAIGLARAHRKSEVDPEMKSVLEGLDRLTQSI